MRTPVTERHYYDTNPPQRHCTGDLWTGLPTHGLLRQRLLPGLVITPACDLAQAKVETITYLPVLPISDWFSTTSFQGDLFTALRGEARLLGLDARLGDTVSPPPVQPAELIAFEDALSAVTPSDQRSREAHARCRSGIRLMRAILNPSPVSAMGDARGLLGPRQWSQLLRQLVTNYRKDLHFLPADRLPTEWSVVTTHSVVLFRCPLTAPVSIFAAAQDVSVHDWTGWVREVEAHIPLAAAFRTARPMKGLALKKDFLADLLTRYAALYLRIGSPDFTSDTVDEFVAQLEPR
jgi:hypothetical protein